VRTHFKAWAEPYLNEHRDFVILPNEVNDKFDERVTVLEVGSGKGLMITTMALHHPEVLYFGMEKNVTCAGFFAKKINELPYKNCFLIYEDFEKAYIDLPKFDVVMLSFPDPWPKKRHEKRRLVCPSILGKLASLLKENGYLRLKTDNDGLFEYAKKTFANSNLEMVEIIESYPSYMPVDEYSEYETNFRNQGHSIHEIIYQNKRK